MSARELRSGRELNLWGDALLHRRKAPFDTGPDSVFVAYAAAAEMQCFLALGWPPPKNIIDLFAEHRVETNGRRLPFERPDSLLSALALRGLAHMADGDKHAMRELIMSKPTLADYTLEERSRTQAYCREDTLALEALLPKMKFERGLALHRGRFSLPIAHMQQVGMPIDMELREGLLRDWDDLRLALIDDINVHLGFYEDGHLRRRLFEQWLIVNRLHNTWPRTPTGLPSTDEETLETQTFLHPEVPAIPLFKELKATLDQMKIMDLAVGADGYHRASLHPYRTITGRNAPTNFIFRAAKWMRGLLKPPPGYGLAYIDFVAQEVAIAAALSHDARMAEHYRSDDIYWRFAVTHGLDSRGAHAPVRALVKILFLAIGYGMSAWALAAKAGIPLAEAHELIALHLATYPDFARWRANIVDAAHLEGWLKTSFGWARHGCADLATRKKGKPSALGLEEEMRRWGQSVPDTELMNWPIQSAGAELMRIVCIAAVEAGINLLAPIHDGFLIMAPVDRLDHDIVRMKDLMERSSRVITRGLTIRAKEEVVTRYPDRFMDEKGEAMWKRIMALYEGKIRNTVAA
jgi:hypothetical protein